jgi:hypothetical protein
VPNENLVGRQAVVNCCFAHDSIVCRSDTILRCAICSFFSSTFVYRSLSGWSRPELWDSRLLLDRMDRKTCWRVAQLGEHLTR